MPEHIQLNTLGLVFFTALFLSLFIVPLTVVLARKVGAVDIPKNRSSHTIPTTRLGGLGISASMVFSYLMFLPLNNFAWAFLAGLLVIIVTGLVDDLVTIGSRWKFVGQIVAAVLFILLGGGTLVHLGDFVGGGEITLGVFAIPFTIFCMVGAMNAFNLSDGLDGLAGGTTLIASVFFTYFSWKVGAVDLLLVCVALLGALIGFLRYNSYPAKLFMGDCGSLTLGYVLAALLVSGSQREGTHLPLVIWAMVLALPLLDTLLVMARRVRYGHSPFLPDRTHLHHRLMDLGFAHPAVVAVMYAVMTCFGVLAIAMRGYPDWYGFILIWLMGLAVFGSVSLLQHIGFSLNLVRRRHPYSMVRKWPLFKRVSKATERVAIRVSVILLLLVCLPALLFHLPVLNRNEVAALLILAGVVVYYSSNLTHDGKGILHGSVYVSIFVLFFLYNVTEVADTHWSSIYLVFVPVLASAWVVIKIVFQRRSVVLKTSGFELLMLFLSWFLPFVLLEGLNLSMHLVDAGRLACLEALPFMLAAKVYFNLQPQGNRWVVFAMTGAMAVVAIRGLLG